jgi:hypothetical protein
VVSVSTAKHFVSPHEFYLLKSRFIVCIKMGGHLQKVFELYSCVPLDNVVHAATSENV